MVRSLRGPGLVVLGVALALAGCSPAPVIERLPTELGGMPSAAPPAPRQTYQYPAVHDRAPPRADAPLTDEQQLELEKRLQKAREQQESQATDLKNNPNGGAKPAK